MSTSLLLPSSGQKSGASDHILCNSLTLFEPFNTGILFPTFLHHSSHFLFDRIIRDKANNSRHQVKHCKFSSLLLTALCLTGRNTQFHRALLGTIEDSSGQSSFYLFCPAKENHPVMAIFRIFRLEDFPGVSMYEAVSWFYKMVSVSVCCL